MTAGAVMQQEMEQQPAVLRGLLDRRPQIARLLRPLVPHPLRGIVLLARGSSDNAATHGRYVLEAVARVPVALAAPSLHTRYGVRTRLDGFLVIAVSQSGATPEIVSTLEIFRDGGASTVALTNVAGSPLAAAADATILLDAGEERAVPATKTFTAQAAAFSLLADVLADDPQWSVSGWLRAIDAVEDALSSPEQVMRLAQRVVEGDRILPVARGLLYGAALEVGLKLAETTGLAVHGTSPADLQHGPIAGVAAGTVAVGHVAPGPVAADVRELAGLIVARGGQVAVITEDPTLVSEATVHVPVLAGVPEPLAILPHVVRGQQCARAAALSLGIDPDAPFGLRKVTPTS